MGKLHAPVPFVVVVPITAPSLRMVMVAPASLVPLITGAVLGPLSVGAAGVTGGVVSGGSGVDVPVMVSALGDDGVRLVPLRAISVSPKGIDRLPSGLVSCELPTAVTVRVRRAMLALPPASVARPLPSRQYPPQRTSPDARMSASDRESATYVACVPATTLSSRSLLASKRTLDPHTAYGAVFANATVTVTWLPTATLVALADSVSASPPHSRPTTVIDQDNKQASKRIIETSRDRR